MSDYELHHYDKELLKQTGITLGSIEVPSVSDLEQVRLIINKFCDEGPESPRLTEWCFVDCKFPRLLNKLKFKYVQPILFYKFLACTAERFFRVDRAQENLHYVTDIASDVIYVLDQECPTLPQTPEDDGPPLIQPHISSLESSDKDSREGTPSTPNKKFFNRSLSGPNSGGTSDSLSPALDAPSRKSSQGSQGSNCSPKNSLDVPKDDSVGNGQTVDTMVNFKS